MTTIETERLRIRRFQSDDFESLVSLMTDAETMKFTGFRVPQAAARIRELLSKWEEEGLDELGVWAVEKRTTEEFVGWIMLKPTATETPELGYMLDRSQWGQGFATEVATEMLRYGFEVLRIPKIVAVTSPDNLASVRVLEKAGMRRSTEAGEDGGVCYEIELGTE